MRPFLLVLYFLSLAARGEELVAAAQRELVARKFYFGEVDGRPTPETVAAIEKFQLARGLDKTGQLDRETRRALALPEAGAGEAAEGKALEGCCDWVREYLRAWEAGVWRAEADFFAETVNYYDDQEMTRDGVRELRAQENQRWPYRKATMLQRIASAAPGPGGLVQVTARVRMEVGPDAEHRRARTEDLVFRLQPNAGGWRIIALKLLE